MSYQTIELELFLVDSFTKSLNTLNTEIWNPDADQILFIEDSELGVFIISLLVKDAKNFILNIQDSVSYELHIIESKSYEAS